MASHVFDPSKPRLDRPFFLITVFEEDAIAASTANSKWITFTNN